MLRRSLRPVNQAQRKPKGGGRLRPLSRAGRACTFGPSAGVAEWQTRQTQNLLPVREWGFKSLHPHQSGLPPTKIGRRAPTVDGLRKARAQGGDERGEIVGRNN